MTADRPVRVRRTLLITPGHRPERMAKAAGMEVDSVAFDLEDGVAPEAKSAARMAIADVLRTVDFGRRERLVRVNGLESGLFDADLAALPLDRVDGLFLPKVSSPEEAAVYEARVAAAEARAGRSVPLAFVYLVETARGLFNLPQTVMATKRVEALVFGSGDYSAETGNRLTPAALDFPRGMIAAAAGMAGIQAIDAAFLDVKDAAGTRADAERAREHGFAGKLVFHPNQVDAVNVVFTPDAAEIAHAKRLIAAYEAAVARGDGTAYVDGAFVAVDLLPPARRTLAVARHAGLIE